MNNLDELEEKIRQKQSAGWRSQKKMKVSGKSVFKLQTIIKRKSAKVRKNAK